MEYIDVAWRHTNPGDPVRLVSEVNESRDEVRKLEFWANGDVGFASSEKSSRDTILSVVPVPSLQEINADPQFVGVHIDAATFESLWSRHALHDT